MITMNLMSVVMAGEPLGSSSDGIADLMARGLLFLLCLLMFVLLCGIAWRKIPALRKIVPQPEEANELLKAKQPEFKPSRVINLMQVDKPAKSEPVAEAAETSVAVEPAVPTEDKPAAPATPIMEAIEKARQKARERAAQRAAEAAQSPFAGLEDPANSTAEADSEGLALPASLLRRNKKVDEAVGEGGAEFHDLEEALADGKPGAVVRAASDLNGVSTNTPIVIVKRED